MLESTLTRRKRVLAGRTDAIRSILTAHYNYGRGDIDLPTALLDLLVDTLHLAKQEVQDLNLTELQEEALRIFREERFEPPVENPTPKGG